MNEVMVACRAGACDADQVEVVMAQLHDALIEANPVRSGPVRWSIYDTSDLLEIEQLLRIAKFHPATDLLEWIRANRGVKLVIATVHVPVVAAAGRA